MLLTTGVGSLIHIFAVGYMSHDPERRRFFGYMNLFVAFARMHGNLDGQVIAFFVMVVAAAEVVVGLAILMTVFRTRRSASVDDVNLLKY